MVSDLFFSELLLLGLLWLCVMLHWVWPYDRAALGLTTPTPGQPRRKRSHDPTPCPGLTRTPHCAVCEQVTQEPAPAPPPTPPPPITSRRGRPRHVDTSQQFCPNPDCDYRGWVGWGNLSANGHPNGGPWRQLYGRQCAGDVLETHGTPFHGTRVSPDLLVWAVGALAEGLGIRAVARVFEVDPNPALQWLIQAADQLKAFSQYFLHDVRGTQVQLDELDARLSAVKDGEVSEAGAITRLSRSPHWGWVAIDPVTKFLLALDVGDRTLAMAQRFVHQVGRVVAPDCVPLLLTDGFKEDITALLTHFGHGIQPERRQATGPRPQPRWRPLPQLLYAQVINVTRRRRLVAVKRRVVFGTTVAVEQVLAACDWQINTSFIARVTLSIRQHVAAVGRRVMTRCKGQAGLRQQLALSHTYDNFCLPHASVRQPLPQPAPTNGSGSAKRWQPQTPAMAAGLTDHVWTLRDVLLCRVPLWSQPQAV
jgi:hypothetical protein